MGITQKSKTHFILILGILYLTLLKNGVLSLLIEKKKSLLSYIDFFPILTDGGIRNLVDLSGPPTNLYYVD